MNRPSRAAKLCAQGAGGCGGAASADGMRGGCSRGPSDNSWPASTDDVRDVIAPHAAADALQQRVATREPLALPGGFVFRALRRGRHLAPAFEGRLLHREQSLEWGRARGVLTGAGGAVTLKRAPLFRHGRIMDLRADVDAPVWDAIDWLRVHSPLLQWPRLASVGRARRPLPSGRRNPRKSPAAHVTIRPRGVPVSGMRQVCALRTTWIETCKCGLK